MQVWGFTGRYFYLNIVLFTNSDDYVIVVVLHVHGYDYLSYVYLFETH